MANSKMTPSRKTADEASVAMPASLHPESATPARRARKSRLPSQIPIPDGAELQCMIAEAAYYLAEKRSFAPGFEQEDWATATAEIMAKLGKDIA